MKPYEATHIGRGAAGCPWQPQSHPNDMLVIPRSLATRLEAFLDSISGDPRVVAKTKALLEELRSREP